jgi:3-(3-hydroxy-phenyl)propionate hydroxylase
LGGGFTLLSFGPADSVDWNGITAQPLVVGRDLTDAEGLVAARFDGRPGSCYLIRPDQHVAARWRSFDLAAVRAAIAQACTAKGTH